MQLTIGTKIPYEEEKRKVRLISIKDDCILICNYNGFFMLPGGKIENNETADEAVIREIYEETGTTITNPLPIIEVHNYVKDYPSQKRSDPFNCKLITTYYINNKPLNNISSDHLSLKEISSSFTISYIKIAKLIEILTNNDLNRKQQIFAQEILTILKNIPNIEVSKKKSSYTRLVPLLK